MQRAHLAIGLALSFMTGLPSTPDQAVRESATAARAPSDGEKTAAGSARVAKVPLRFEANAGQWDARVRFVSHDRGATLSITDDAMMITLREIESAKTSVVTMRLVGARPSAPVGEQELASKSNFFIGDDPTQWRTDVANFAEVRAKNWIAGVDVVWHEADGGFEYDLDVAANTDASLIALDVEGASSLSVAMDGALEMTTPAGVLLQKPPRVVQDGRELRTRYRLDGKLRVAFDIDGYDRSHAVLIDPSLVYSTYLGGSKADNGAYHMAVDSAGSAYISGWGYSSDYPTASPYQASLNGSNDIVVTKLSSSGSLVYSTYLGGSGPENGSGIAVDSSGNAYVGGATGSTDFPTKNPVQSSNAGSGDAFITELNANGNGLVYSTYYGGSGQEGVGSLAVDSSGNAYVTGPTQSSNFPTVSAIQKSAGGFLDTFVTEISAGGTSVVYSTYLGGKGDDQGYGIAVDGSGNAYIAGFTLSTDFPTVSAMQGTNAGGGDVFVTVISSGGSSISYSTYLGGSAKDEAFAIALDSSGNIYLTGHTSSTDFPTASPIQSSIAGAPDAFVTKLNTSGTLDYSTYLGGSTYDYGRGIAVDSAGSAYVAGGTMSTDFPTASPTQSSNAGTYDGFVTQLNSSGSSIVFSTYLGGSSSDQTLCIRLDSSNNTYAAGFTQSSDFPTVNAAQGSYAGAQDFFVAKLSTGGPVALGISPKSVTVAPKGSKTFSAYGGSGSGYTFSFTTNASGGTIGSSTGVYTAGSTASVTDVVKVTDSDASTATANVTVGPGVSIAPTSPAPSPKGTINFSATGGSGAGFTWTLTTNNSGGSIIASTGVYKAGATGSVTDVVTVTDSLSNTATINVKVGAGVSITPTSPSSPPNGTLNFSASGGSGTGFAWSLTTNNSGGSIGSTTGTYTAGTTGSTLDTVSVSDSLGNTASIAVNVGASVTISPSSPTPPPKGAVSFSASGGSGAGFTWSLLINNSGGSINASSGAYTAGATGSVSDTVKVVDSLGNVASVTVTVGAGVAISPMSPTTPPKGSIGFSATGGSSTGYTWSLTTNASGGSVNVSSGAYVAGATASVSDVVKVTDSLGNVASVTVTVGAGVTISPSLPSTPPKGALTFTAVGGSGTGFTWLLSMNKSGGTINGATGEYTAGATGNVADTVTVTDSLGNTASVNVSVGGGLAINPAAPTSPPKGAIAFVVIGGSGSGFVWTLTTNKSGGTIDSSSGAYVAGATPSVTDTIGVVDALGNTSSIDVIVTAGVSISPTSVTLAPGSSTTFSSAGGSGKGYVFSIATNNSGGNITSDGLYTAGAKGGVNDDVALVDSLGNSAHATVTVSSLDAGTDAGVGTPSSGGCGCGAAGAPTSQWPLAAFVAVMLLAFQRRRRLLSRSAHRK